MPTGCDKCSLSNSLLRPRQRLISRMSEPLHNRNALDMAACGQTTALSDPIVASGGAFRPLHRHELWDEAAAPLFALWPERLMRLDLEASHGPQLTKLFEERGANFVGVILGEGGHLLLLDSAADGSSDAIWTQISLAASAKASMRVGARGLRRARDMVRFGDSAYILAPDTIHVHDIGSLQWRRTLPLAGVWPVDAAALAISSSAVFVLRRPLPAGAAGAAATGETIAGVSGPMGGGQTSATTSELHVLERHDRRSAALLRDVAVRSHTRRHLM